jgi:hypothetical protein
MRNTKSKQSRHEVGQSLAVSTVDFRDGEEDEGERDGLKEVGVAADSNLERIRLRLLSWVADVFLVLYPGVLDGKG